MLRSRGGYTIVEVMLVLGISGVMLTSAIILVGGLRGGTEFSQAMRDVQSKFQSEINSVRTGTFAFNDSYDCKTIASADPLLNDRPSLTASASASGGTSKDCLFLGKALQVVPGQSTLYIYSVLGNRTYKVDGAGNRALVTTFDQANPIAANAAGADLTKTYNFSSSAAVTKSAQANGVNAESDMAGFYTNLQSSAGNSASQSLFAKAYNLTSSSGDASSGVQNCIEQQNSCSNAPLTKWDICFDSSDKKQTAQLSILASSTGILTQLNFISC